MSCEVARDMGTLNSRFGGLVNEGQGLIIDIRNIRLRLRGNSEWAFCLSDFAENESGIWCAHMKPECTCE